eukprot:7308411-Pyramimonas_sp.AAC.1
MANNKRSDEPLCMQLDPHPPSMVSLTAPSSASANAASGALASSRARCRSPPDHAKMLHTQHRQHHSRERESVCVHCVWGVESALAVIGTGGP